MAHDSFLQYFPDDYGNLIDPSSVDHLSHMTFLSRAYFYYPHARSFWVPNKSNLLKDYKSHG